MGKTVRTLTSIFAILQLVGLAYTSYKDFMLATLLPNNIRLELFLRPFMTDFFKIVTVIILLYALSYMIDNGEHTNKHLKELCEKKDCVKDIEEAVETETD